MMQGNEINIGLNTRPTRNDSRMVKAAQGFNTTTSSRGNAIRKSKSVGYDNACIGLFALSTTGSRTLFDEGVKERNSTDMLTSYRNSRIDSRTVKSDTCLSPRKLKTADFGYGSADSSSGNEKSPTSALEFDKKSSDGSIKSEKKSFSNHGSSVLEMLSGYSNNGSHRTTFNLSSHFSGEDESEVSSFADDDISSLPKTVPQSISNFSLPSELTASIELSPNMSEGRRKLSHNISRISTDIMPCPPRRKTSDKDLTSGSQFTALVPQHIQCFSLGENTQATSQQEQLRCNLLQTSSTFDLSPKKPLRQNSYNSSKSDISILMHHSGISIDSSPQKPVRQESHKSIFSSLSVGKSIIRSQHKRRSSTPPRRKVDRSESQLQPRLPTLVRRTSIIEKKLLPRTSHDSLSFLQDAMFATNT